MAIWSTYNTCMTFNAFGRHLHQLAPIHQYGGFQNTKSAVSSNQKTPSLNDVYS